MGLLLWMIAVCILNRGLDLEREIVAGGELDERTSVMPRLVARLIWYSDWRMGAVDRNVDVIYVACHLLVVCGGWWRMYFQCASERQLKCCVALEEDVCSRPDDWFDWLLRRMTVRESPVELLLWRWLRLSLRSSCCYEMHFVRSVRFPIFAVRWPRGSSLNTSLSFSRIRSLVLYLM